MLGDDGELAAYFSALANAHRLAVLRTLAEGEVCVRELALRIGLGRSALSQHLNILRRHQLVKQRREAQTTYYSLSGSRSDKALLLVNTILFPYGVQLSMFGFSDVTRDGV